MTSTSKADANRLNAKASTGPRTPAGKARSSSNAISHGVLSRHLLLPDEDPSQWISLLSRLLDELRPVGTLEQTLVERIAVALWRQRRVIWAETARISIAQSPGVSEKMEVRQILGGDSDLIDSVLEGRGESTYRQLHEELLRASEQTAPSLDALRADYPGLWANLVAAAPAGDAANFLSKRYGGKLTQYLAALMVPVKRQVAAYDYLQRKKDAATLPFAPELMTRYQAALDNDLYKAMRALRDAQRFCRELIETVSESVSEETNALHSAGGRISQNNDTPNE